jgi:pseudaminic acid biosynthesis-associated methylase
MNAKALRLLFPRATFSGVEINSEACNQLRSVADIVFESSIEDFNADSIYDFVFTKGVLIHLAPESLNDAYNKLYDSSSRWILIAEYYNPSPVALEYRGFKDKLFKRDFAGELMKLHRDLDLRASGFAYHSGPFPQDDISWFLFEKANR